MNEVRVFSNGTEYMAWNNANCCECARYHVVDGEVVEPVCPLEEALSLASIDDGTVSHEMAGRMGLPSRTMGGRTCKEFVQEVTR